MEDIIHMTKTNLKANHIRIENLYKSMFSEVKNTSIDIRDDKVEFVINKMKKYKFSEELCNEVIHNWNTLRIDLKSEGVEF